MKLNTCLYYATGIEGNFNKIMMFNDGTHNDGAAGDGVKLTSPQAADQFVVINEIMAKNKTVVKDEADQYDDWIELYNTSSSAKSLNCKCFRSKSI